MQAVHAHTHVCRLEVGASLCGLHLISWNSLSWCEGAGSQRHIVTHTQLLTDIHAWTYLSKHRHAHTRANTHTDMFLHIQACAHTQMLAHMYTQTHRCMHGGNSACVHIYPQCPCTGTRVPWILPLHSLCPLSTSC